jgi:hypothetical protein
MIIVDALTQLQPALAPDHGQVNGSAAEHLACAALLLNGFKVYHQDHDSGASDLVIEDGGGRLYRCQVKAFYVKTFAGKRASHYVACLERSGSSKTRTPESRDIRKHVDYFALADLATGEVFLLASAINKSSISKASAAKLGTRIFPRNHK